MYFVYSIIFSVAFVLMLPLFLLRREKYASGFSQRFGNYPEFKADAGRVIWLHCVSVGETNAARPLVEKLREAFPDHRLVISTTTRTGQELARKLFTDKADAIIYFPFDWKFSVRRALENFKPSLVLLMETEIWPRFIHEAKMSGAKVAIVNGRLSGKSFRRYTKVGGFVSKVLLDVDLALMQDEDDVGAIRGLGMDPKAITETGNLKFDLAIDASESEIARQLRDRFNIGDGSHLIVAASTHSPEERLVLAAFEKVRTFRQFKPRLLIAPRHPERFDEVERVARGTALSVSSRSADRRPEDKDADVIILDTIGELRAVFALADIVFVGGSLIPHGGQSVLEPAAAGKAIITGPHTKNFKSVIEEFLTREAIIQLDPRAVENDYVEPLAGLFESLLRDRAEREHLGRTAKSVMDANRGATERTVALLRQLVPRSADGV